MGLQLKLMSEEFKERREVNIANSELSLTKVVGVCVFLLGIGWGFVTTVVIPISNIQIKLAQIQATLQTNAQSFSTLQAQVNANSSDILILKSKQK